MADAHTLLSRRALVASGAAAAGATLIRSHWTSREPVPPTVRAKPSRPTAMGGSDSLGSLDPKLLGRALTALDRHGDRIGRRDRLAIVDFAAPSSQPRLHLVDLAQGKAMPFLVAHGSGSDPAHTGFLQRFSNLDGSNASSEGAFVTADYYVGKHGRSQRLLGLDPTNNNALDRAIVIHGAWYADADMIQSHGKLGRSQGCFAVGDRDLNDVFRHLGEGRMIYAAKA